jgi:transposase
MSKSNFSEEFKRDAVRQNTQQGYPAAEVSQRLGVSPHSLYESKKKFSSGSGNQAATRPTRSGNFKRSWRVSLRSAIY